MATIVDEFGNPLYHVVSTKWSRLAIVVLTGMLSVITLIAILLYINNARITDVNTRVDKVETKAKKTDNRQDASDNRQNVSDNRQTRSEANANK